MIQQNGGMKPSEKSLAPYGEEGSGMGQRLDDFAAALSDPAALSEPIWGSTRGGAGKAGVRGAKGRGPTTGEEEFRNQIGKKPPKPKSSRGGGGVSGQGNAQPGGVYTPNPDI